MPFFGLALGRPYKTPCPQPWISPKILEITPPNPHNNTTQHKPTPRSQQNTPKQHQHNQTTPKPRKIPQNIQQNPHYNQSTPKHQQKSNNMSHYA